VVFYEKGGAYMDFNIELTEFPSMLHSCIYSAGRSVMPLPHTLEAVSDPVMRESCQALHGLITNMLSDMYNNPEAYYLPVMKIEEFCGGKPLQTVKREFPKKIKEIYADTRHAAKSYIELLRVLGHRGEIINNALIVSEEDIKYAIKNSNSTISPIKLSKRLEALNRVGLMMETLPTGGSRFISKNYLNIFPVLRVLPYHQTLLLNFRLIDSNNKPTHDDYYRTLFIKQREQAHALHDFAMRYKMRVNPNANFGVIYQFKSKKVLEIGTGDDIRRFLGVTVGCIDRGNDLSVIERHLKKESLDFQKEALQHMAGCDTCQTLHCSTYASGWYDDIMGKRHQRCGGGGIDFNWREPVEADMAMIKRLIEIRCAIIDEAQAAKKK
jgi:hypothetical protein